MFEFVVKSVIYSTLTIGGGYAIMISCTPTPAQMEERLLASGKYTKENLAAQREKNRLIMVGILQNSQSDAPVWQVAPVKLEKVDPTN